MYSGRDESVEHSAVTLANDVPVADYKKEDPNGYAHLHLSRAEQELLEAWNATRQVYSRTTCVPQLIERQAALTPTAIALVAGERKLSYQELNHRANQLANQLRAYGVRPNVLVGLCVERSCDLVLGLLGILKAGGAYVPLDPGYPADRLTFMLEDAHAPVLITQRHLLSHLTLHDIRTVCLDSDAGLLDRQQVTNPPSLITADDLAYVIYTSGSTGRPKGAQIIHDGLLNLVYWHQRAFGVTAHDRATQVASPAFDATVWELWPYLTCGASVYFPTEETRVNPSAMRDWLVDREITITFLPTPLAESVLGLEWPAATKLRYLLTGADKLQHYPSPRLPFALINNYGLSEATVVNTSGRVWPTENEVDRPPSIGRPIANTQIYLLDEHLQPVPIGEPGELYIAGAGVGRGYLNRPELTAERFIHHPFRSEPGARLYKTGDLARYLPDGQLEFIGRIDQQIKLRGYRIEPSEIVSALNAHAAVAASAVVAREDASGEKRLVAYLVPVHNQAITACSVREALLERLPDYMLPADFVLLDELPLTRNGKVDRAALPAPEAANTLRDAVSAAPTTPTEERVAAIVERLLNLEQVGVDDNFFMLGGHSLLGTQIIANVSEAFGVDLPLRTLFEAPNVRALAAEIERMIVLKLEGMNDDEVLRLLQSSSN